MSQSAATTFRYRPTQSEPARRKVSIGRLAPRLSLTAFVKGHYVRLDPAVFSGRWIALCFPTSLQASDMACLNWQAGVFAREGAVLVAVCSDLRLRRLADQPEFSTLAVPILTDPLNRLHRSYGIPRHEPSTRSITFLIDPEGVLRFHVHHDLTIWDLDALRRLIDINQPAPHPGHGGPFARKKQVRQPAALPGRR